MSYIDKTQNRSLSFVINGDYYGFEYNDVPYNYIKNLQGDVVAIADGAGNILVQYYYDAWGRILEIDDDSTNSIGTINPIRYRSYYYDTETGFYYLKTRYYSTEICRFLSPDSLIDNRSVNTQNLFSYCANNPVNNTDSTGMMHVEHAGIAGGNWNNESFSVGLATYYSKVEDVWNFDNLFFGVVEGDTYTVSATSNKSNDVVFFFEKSHENGSVYDNKLGMNVNIENGGFRISKGFASYSITACFNDTSYEFFLSPSKSGFTISYDVDYKNLSAGRFKQVYIRPIPTACVLIAAYYCPAAASAFASYLVAYESCFCCA